MNSIHADHPLYQQIVKAVEVFTRARFTEPHTVEFQHKGSTLTLTWNSLDTSEPAGPSWQRRSTSRS